MVDLVREHRAGRLEFFAPPGKPGPKRGQTSVAAHARDRTIELWLEGLTAKQISERLAIEGIRLSRTGVSEVLDQAGLRGRRQPAAAQQDSLLPGVGVQDFDALPTRQQTTLAGLLLLVPELVALDLPALVDRAGYPDTRRIPAVSWLLALLALKLLGRGKSVNSDPAPALLTGLTALPRQTALSEYSYWPPSGVQRAFLSAMITKGGLITPGQRVFGIDMRDSGPRHGDLQPEGERPGRPQRQTAVFASAADTGKLVFADVGADPHTLVMAFCDHWRQVTGADPELLVVSGKAAARKVLRSLHEREIAFLAPRPASPALRAFLAGLPLAGYQQVLLASSEFRAHEEPAVPLPGFPGHVRQLNLALDDGNPTVLVTSDRTRDTAELLELWVLQATRERQISGLTRVYGTEAWSSTVNLNADVDVMLYVVIQALLSAVNGRLPALAERGQSAFRRYFLELPAELTTSDQALTVRFERQAWSPILRKAVLPEQTIVPWWGGRRLRFRVG